MYRIHEPIFEVLLARPAGPFVKNKDAGALSIPKGEVALDEEFVTCAMRENEERSESLCSACSTI